MTTIMIVDDAADIRLLVRAVLQRAGNAVVEAESGPAALGLLDAGLLPDAVILDVQMPEVDGWETLQAIRRHPDAGGTPVVMCTVRSRPDDARHAWSLGCDGYLTKPFTIADLCEEVAAVASRTPTERLAMRRARLDALREESDLTAHQA
jgi:CheY-like chemotaxis protein